MAAVLRYLPTTTGFAWLLLCVTCALPARRARAQSEAPPPDEPPSQAVVPHVPEPMVFDLVRGLGARQWEVEANTLFMLPLDPNDWEMSWAPEIELALADGFAIELELPMRDDQVDALKTAAQLTFGTAADGRFIHGTQAIVEHELAHDATQTSLLYLAGVELDPTWSLLVMAGFRTTFAEPIEQFRMETLVNMSLFARVASWMVLGLEANYADDFERGRELLVMPQAHLKIGDHLRWQLGVGFCAAGEDRHAVASSRVIVEL